VSTEGMQPVLTKEQAKKVTKGRTPLVPVEYETAIQALTECANLNETKYWSDKADALAAWAKIYHSDEAGRKAKLLKMHAYRRMGQLAGEIRPKANKKPGPRALLVESGLTLTEAAAARTLSRITDKQFTAAQRAPASPITVARRFTDTEPVWGGFSRPMYLARAFMRDNKPLAVIRAIDPSHYDMARQMAIEVSEWLDELEQKLPKEK